MKLNTLAAATLLACLTLGAQAAAPIEPTGRWTANAQGSASLPPMGWNSWNAFFLEVDEEKVLGSARKLVDSGLAKLGYVYVNIDDGWWSHRDTRSGRMVIKTSIFPSARREGKDTSFRPLTDRIHAMGLKAGIYTDIGYHSCGQAFSSNAEFLPKGTQAEKRIGLEGHTDQDIQTYFADWGFDFIKVDACGLSSFAPDSDNVLKKGYTPLAPLIWRGTPNLSNVAAVRGRYQAVADALAKYRPQGDYLLSLCAWGMADVRSWGKEIGNTSRTSDDIMPVWGRMLHNLDSTSKRALYAHPGSWNDPDMLFVGHGDFDQHHLTEARSHFALWAMLNAPLIIGYDLRNAPPALMDIFGNAAIVALNQDAGGHQATLGYDSNDAQIYVKSLADPSKKAVLLLNRGTADLKVTLLAEHLKLDPAQPVTLRNLWTGESSVFTGKSVYQLKAHESLVFEVSGTRLLRNGVYLSEIPGLINVAADGVRQPEIDPVAHRAIQPWEGTLSGGERPLYTGWGGAQVDATPYDQNLQLNGATYRTGIGILDGSRMEVKNDQRYRRFSATVGVVDSTRNMQGSAQFEIYGDGRLLARSKALKFRDAPQQLAVDTAGVKVLELVARPLSRTSDLPVLLGWADAALTDPVK